MPAPPQELLLAQEPASPATTDAHHRWLPLLQRLETLGWIKPGERLTRTEPAGIGNMNRTLRIELRDAQSSRSLVLKQALPYVARYPDIAAPVERGAVEAAFYRIVEPVPAVAGRMPRLLGFDPDHHLLALEDLGAARDFGALYDVQPATDREGWRAALPTILDWLLALHTQVDPTSAPSNQAMRSLNHEHIFVVPYADPVMVDLSPELAGLQVQLRQNVGVQDRLDALGSIYLGQSDPGSPRVLLHGDFYPGSWLLDPGDQPRIIDTEFCFAGPAEFDLGVMRAHLALAGEPADTWSTLLDHYQATRAVDRTLLDAFAAAEILRRIFGVAQLPLTLTQSEQLALCTRAWQTLAD